MKLYGWTTEQIETACEQAAVRISLSTHLRFDGRVITTHGRRGVTSQGVLRFARSTARLKDGSYPPGVLVRNTFDGNQRSCGAPCWHTFGHFFRALFELNDNGRVVTARATYNGSEGFEENYSRSDGNIGSQFMPQQYSDACECWRTDAEDF